MLELRVHEFVEALRIFQHIEALVDTNTPGREELINEENAKTIGQSLLDLSSSCSDMGAEIAAEFVVDAQAKLSSGSLKWTDLASDTKLIYAVLSKEMTHAKLFSIPQEKIVYFDDPFSKFSPDVFFSYFSAYDDIDEAGKCFALGRYTSCIFHLMRVLERPINGLAKTLLPKDSIPNWGTVLNKIDTELAKKPTERSFKGDVQFFAEVAAEMRAVQHAWRNRVMHIDTLATEE